MDRLRKVVNNTVISLVGQLITWTSTLLLTIAYGRFLGDTKFGELYFALTFVLLIGIPIERGFNQQLTRDVAQEPGKALRYLSNTLLIKMVLWIILYNVILLASGLLGYTMEVRTLVAICGLTLLSTAITSTFASLLYAFERAAIPVVGTILEKGLSALFGFLLLRNGAGVEVMALVLLGGSLTNGVWHAVLFFRLVGLGFVIELGVIRHLLRTSIPFLAYGVMGVLYYRLDTILLSFMTNNAVVGWYGAGYRLFDTMIFLPSLVVVPIMYPIFTKFSVTSQADLRLAVEKCMNFLLFCVIPIAMLMIVAAPNIIGFLYHRDEFVHTVPVLQALAPGLIFLYMNTVHGTVIVSTNQEKKTTIMAGAALVFNLGLNLILIPLYQHVGAAIVTSLTEALIFCIGLLFVPRHLLPMGSLRVGTKAVIASLIMVVAIWPLLVFNIFVILPVGILVYLGVAILLGTIPREDLKALYTAIRHKAKKTAPASFDDQQEMELADVTGNEDEDTVPVKALYDVIQHYTDDDTIPMRALFRKTPHVAQTRPVHLDHQQETPVKALYDVIQHDTDDDTVPMRALFRKTPHVAQTRPVHLDHQQETPGTRELIAFTEAVE